MIMAYNKFSPLPEKITLQQERIAIDEALRGSIRELQGAWNGLRGITELQPLSTDLKDMTKDWLNGFIQKRFDLIEKDMSLTDNERALRLKSWGIIKARGTRYINIINHVLSSWPDACWTFDSNLDVFYCSNIDHVVESRATHEVPKEAQTHWRMIWECIEKVIELRKWEDQNDVKSRLLADYQTMEQQKFAEMWITDEAKFDRRFSHLGINPQNYNTTERVII